MIIAGGRKPAERKSCAAPERAAPESTTTARASVNPVWQRLATRIAASGGVLQRKCATCGSQMMAGAPCAECEEEEQHLQRQPDGQATPDTAPPLVHDVLGAPGQSLEPGTKAFFEPRFGRDLSDVRVHTDARAAASARAVRAVAYTVGRHIVFNAGEFAPATAAGQNLLAHELAHVRQQRSDAALPARLPVNTPDGADERAADEAATRAMRGEPADTASPTATKLQRAVRESVVSNITPGAHACLVHLHRNEENAFHVASDMHGSHCTNFVHLSAGATREIHVDPPAGRGATCLADPNRIFTATGINSHAIVGQCPARRRSQVKTDLTAFRDQSLMPAINVCRREGEAGGPLPIVAYHNNTPGALSIRSYQPGGSEAGATETDPARLGGATNPAVVAGQDPDDFFLTTDPRDFAALGATRNVVLQAATPADDGSLSVALSGTRYINVETEGKRFTRRTAPQFVTNLAMGQEALTALGVPARPCAQPASGQTGGATQPQLEGAPVLQRRPDNGAPVSEPNADEASSDPLGDLTEWLRRLLREIERVIEQWSTMPEPLPHEAPPADLPGDCLTFASQADLDTRKAHWAGIIAGMSLLDVVGWIVGTSAPPTATTAEAERQRDCLLHAIRAAAARAGSTISLPAGGLVHSGRRSAADQARIWREKFDFTRRRPFDRISDQARAICGSLLLAGETRWDTRNARHRACWGVAPLPGATAPGMPAGARALTADERQFEILQASSAPGVSRHHWGTDFDLFDPDMNPAEWQTGGSFADEYSWMMRNAATYGFIQSFTATSAFMSLGYIEERWHWSYHPIAQALLEFASTHAADIQTALTALWGSNPAQFSFISRHWRKYMINVGQRGQF